MFLSKSIISSYQNDSAFLSIHEPFFYFRLAKNITFAQTINFMKHIFRLWSFVAFVMLLASCDKPTPKVVLSGAAQGSYYTITYYDKENRDFQSQVDSIFALVDASVSLWNDSSIITKVNHNEPVELNQVFIDNFNAAIEAAELSGGLFDPTVSPLVAMWGFSYKNNITPTQHNIDSILEFVDYHKVSIVDGKVIKQDERISLDFNAIAQGYTSDAIAHFLDAQGVENYLVDVGGEIMARGHKPDGSKWVVGIEKPADSFDSEQIVQTRMELTNMSLVTSGSYRKYVEREGKRYSHTIDPRTGTSVQHNLLSATVLAENATRADALASICMIMGMEKSLELINSLDGVEAFYIYADENEQIQTYATEGFKTF